MKVTLSVIKADIGSIGGHIRPSAALVETVRNHVTGGAGNLLIDFLVGFTGDDIAILMSHKRGTGDAEVHKLAWDAFLAGTAAAKRQGLYGAGQDLLKDAFSGNVKGMGPAVAEMEFEERPSEPFLLFAADKTDPGAYNLPCYLGFADPMVSSGLILSPKVGKGFTFRIMDVMNTEGDRVIDLDAPEDLYDIAALLRDQERFVVESVRSRATGEIAVSVSTTRLHNIAGKYTGKDDPVMLVRTQGNFPATGEVLAPFGIAHFVAGFMRGSHHGALMPVPQNTGTSFFDGPPIVSCMALSMKDGRFTEPADVFAHPYWDHVRSKASAKSEELRRQGFFGPAMLPYSELEYGGIVDRLKAMEPRFRFQADKAPVGG
ncbi:MAG: fructose-1,6-bisphosphate aldolase/phosphatase [Thermodesulfobacteriota bacterium]